MANEVVYVTVTEPTTDVVQVAAAAPVIQVTEVGADSDLQPVIDDVDQLQLEVAALQLEVAELSVPVPDIYAKGVNTSFVMLQNTNGLVWCHTGQVDTYNIIPDSGGIFTVPQDGFYALSCSIQIAAYNNASVNFWFNHIPKSQRAGSIGWYTSAAGATQQSISAIFRLNAGQTFSIGYWTTSSGVTLNDATLIVQYLGGF